MLAGLSHGQAVVLMVANAAMWSIAGVVTRQLESAQSFEITFWRSLFTVLSLLVLLPLTQGRDVFKGMRQGGVSLWLSGVCCLLVLGWLGVLLLHSLCVIVLC